MLLLQEAGCCHEPGLTLLTFYKQVWSSRAQPAPRAQHGRRCSWASKGPRALVPLRGHPQRDPGRTRAQRERLSPREIYVSYGICTCVGCSEAKIFSRCARTFHHFSPYHTMLLHLFRSGVFKLARGRGSRPRAGQTGTHFQQGTTLPRCRALPDEAGSPDRQAHPRLACSAAS